MLFRFLSVAACAALLSACATNDNAADWAPRTDADLAADLATCRAEADGIDVLGSASANEAHNTAAAVAYHYQRQNGRSGAPRRLRAAVRETCMVRKGWVRAE